MRVRVRLFAAAREAAGTAEVDLPAATLVELRATLAARYGARFASCLEVCTVLVDGTPVATGADRALDDGAEVVVLPPFSGGAAAGPWTPDGAEVVVLPPFSGGAAAGP